MFKRLHQYITLLFLVAISSVSSGQTSWTGTKSTSWNSSANWTNGVPTSTTDVIIGDANFNGVNDPTVNVSSSCKSLTLGGTMATTFTLKKNLVINGNLVIESNGTVSHPGSTLTLKGAWTNHGNYISTSNTAKVIFGGGEQMINGSVNTVFRQVSINTGSTVTLGANSAVSGSGSYIYVYGTLNPGETPGFKLTSTVSFRVFNNGKIKVNADLFTTNYALSGSVILYAGSIVNYSSTTTNQVVSPAYTYSTLIISGTGTKSLTANLPVLLSSANSIGALYVNSGTFDLNGFTANRGTSIAGGELSVSNGAVLRVGGTSNFPAGYSTKTLSLASTVEYYNANQTISAETYGNLVLTSTSGSAVKTFPGNAFVIEGNFTTSLSGGSSLTATTASDITINGNTNIGAGTTINGNNNTHTIKGNWINSGTYTGSTGTVNFNAPSLSISGPGVQNFNNVNILQSGITSSGNMNISGNFATSGSGMFTQQPGGLFAMSGASKTISGTDIYLHDFTISGSVTNTGFIYLTGDLSIGGSMTSPGGSIVMTGISKSISGAGSKLFSTLQVTGTVTTAANFSISNLLDVSGSFAATAGNATFTGTSTLSGTANLYNAIINGTTLQLSSSAILGIAGAFTLTAGTLNVTSSLPNTVTFNGAGAQVVTATNYHHLTLSNGNTKSATGNITVNGNFNLASATTFAAGNFTHSILRNWVNSGTFTSTGTIQFTGPNNATLTGATHFNILAVNKSAATTTLSLLNDVNSVTADVVSGILLTGNNKITISSTRTGNGIIHGTITRTHSFATGIPYMFEGPNNFINFESIMGVTSVTVNVKIAGLADFPDNAAVNREYTVAVTGSNYVAALRLHYEDAELNGSNESFLECWKYAPTWSSAGRSINSTSSNYVELWGISDLNTRWTLAQLPGVVRWNGSVNSSWENAANWTSVSGGGSTPPAASDIVQIGTGTFSYNPVVSTAVTVKGISFGSVKAATLDITAGGSIITSGNIGGTWTADAIHNINLGNQNVTINGNLSLGNGVNNRSINVNLAAGNLVVAGSLTQNGNAQINNTSSGNLKIGDNYNFISGSFIPGTGTVTYNGTNTQTVAAIPYHHLSISKSSGIASLNASLTIAGNLAVAGGNLDIDNATLNIAGNVSISAGATLDCEGVTLTTAGNWTNTGNYIFTSGTVVLNGAGVQTISPGSFNNLTINKTSGSAILSGNNIISGNLSLSSGTLNLSTFTINRINAGGVFSMAAGTNLQVGGANNFPGSYSTNTLNAASTVLYNGTVAQSVKAVTYGSLHFSNGGASVKTLLGNATVAADIIINSGAIFHSGGFSTTLNGNWTNSGGFTATTGVVILNGVSKTITGNTTFNRLTVNGSYTVAGSDINYNGNLVVNATGTLTAGNGVANVSADLTNSGSLTSTGTTNFTGTTVQTIRLLNALVSNSTGIINFNGTVAPVLNSTSSPQFANLNIYNTAGISPSVDWIVFTSMTVGAGSAFNGGMSTHTIYGSFTNNGSLTSNGVINFLPATAKTIAFGSSGFTSNGVVTLGGSGLITLTGTPARLKTLIISNANAGSVAAPSNWNIDSSFVITSTARFNAGTYTITVGGNIESDGVLDGGSSTFITTGPTAELVSSTETIFNHLTITGTFTPQTDFRVAGNFTNNGIYDGAIGALIMTGSTAGAINGTTTPTPIAQLNIEKTGNAVVTQNVNISEMLFLNIASGVFFTTTRTVVQDAGGAFLAINGGATLRLGGTNSLPGFVAFSLDANSTVDYAGAATTQIVANTANYGHVIISGAGSKNAYAALTISGNLTMTNGTLNTSTLTVSHSIGGNLIMTGGTLAGTNSTYILNGDSNQVLTLLSPLTRLRINKTTGIVSLGANATVSLGLTFTSGKIVTGNYKLIVPSGGTIAGAAQTTGWVVGNLQKNITTGSAVSRLYELGGATSYTPATLLFATVSTAGDVTGRAMDNDHTEAEWSMIDVFKSVNRNWAFSSSGTVFTTADITLNWVAADLDAGITLANLKVASYDGAAWTLANNTTGQATSIQVVAVSGFKEYAVGENVSAHKWTGGALTNDWFTQKNWNGGVPSTTYNTFIPNSLYAGRVYPVIATGTGIVKDIIIENAASVVVNAATLKVSGSITNNGILNLAQGSVEFNGTSNQYITPGMFTGNKLMNLRISNNVILQTTDTLTGILNVAAGKTFSTNNMLILRSDSLGTASIGALPVDGAGVATAFITGNVTIERFIPKRKAWRLLSAPVKAAGAPTINAAWQEGLTSASPMPNLFPGYGMVIQGGSAANGFDLGLTTNPTIKVFDNVAGNFVAIPALLGTNASIANYPGYFVYIRGDRSVNLMQGNNAAITKTTLRIKGDINTGKITTPVDAKGYTVFGNPFPSAINFATLTRTNVKNTFYIWDPKLAGASGLGGYVTVSYNNSTGNYDITSSASPISQYIPSGEAVILQSANDSTAGTITVKESDKTTNGSDFVFGRTNGLMQQVRINLYGAESNSGRSLLDGVLTTYDVDNSNNVDGNDARKINGGSENISLSRQAIALSIERRASIIKNDTSFISLGQLRIRNYQLEIIADNMDVNNIIAVIKDNYSNSINNMPLNTNGSTLVDFAVNADPASYSPNRFSVVFSVGLVLPVKFKTIKATRVQHAITVDWSVSNEENIQRYEVERSGDGNNFIKIGFKIVNHMTGSFSSYRFNDSTPLTGHNFYRVKSIDQNGKVANSNIVKVAEEKSRVVSTLNVYPNPVTGTSFSLRMNHIVEGKYLVQLFAISGQLVQSFVMYHDGTSSLQKITLQSDFAPGKYELKVSGNQFTCITPLLKK